MSKDGENDKKLRKLLRSLFPRMTVISDEVMQAARIGRWRAQASDFDPSKGSWSNWLGYFVRSEVRAQIKQERSFLSARSRRGTGKTERPGLDYLDAPVDPDSPDLSFHEFVSDMSESPEEVFARLELDEHVRRLVSELPYPERHVVQLWLDGKTHAEIGVELELTRQRIGQIFTRAKLILAEKLKS